MPVVTIEPGGLKLEVKADEAVAEAAWRQGYHWPTTCWGKMECTICAVKVIDGHSHIVPIEAEEATSIRERIPHFLRTPQTRLGCQLKVLADGVVLEKPGVRPPAAS